MVDVKSDATHRNEETHERYFPHMYINTIHLGIIKHWNNSSRKINSNDHPVDPKTLVSIYPGIYT